MIALTGTQYNIAWYKVGFVTVIWLLCLTLLFVMLKKAESWLELNLIRQPQRKGQGGLKGLSAGKGFHTPFCSVIMIDDTQLQPRFSVKSSSKSWRGKRDGSGRRGR